MKGIILAGGTGSRLGPLTTIYSKQLLPIYDKPMIYYPLSVLMLAGIDEILIITQPRDEKLFKNLLGDGSNFGIKLIYKTQQKPNGIAEAFRIGEDFIGNENVCLTLGDNILYGSGLINILRNSAKLKDGAIIFGYNVQTPQDYGVVGFDHNNKVTSIEEKPQTPKSNYAVTGIYFYDNSVIEKSKNISPSARGELEITDINKEYLHEKKLKIQLLGRGVAWLDTGTLESLNDASNFIQVIEKRQGLKVSCPEEIAYKNDWIDKSKLKEIAARYSNSPYGQYLASILGHEQ